MPIYTGGGDDGDTSLFGGERVPKHALRMELIGTIDELSAALGMAAAHAPDTETAPTTRRQPAPDERLSPLRRERVRARPALGTGVRVGPLLQRIQGELFVMGADVATPQEPRGYTIPRIMPEHAQALEAAIDAADEQLAPLTDFVLPGGTHAAAALHFARAVCRRAERIAVALAQEEELPKPILVYLNRLSDLLFTLARLANQQAGAKDVLSKDVPSTAE